MIAIADEPGHEPNLEEARSWVGFKLDESDGRGAGRVEGVLVDSETGEPTWLAIKTGRLRGHSAVPCEHAVAGVGRVWVPYPKETIRSSPEIDFSAGLDSRVERELCEHYGIPAGASRRLAIEARGEGEPTSVPAPGAS